AVLAPLAAGLAGLTVIAVTLANFSVTGLPGWWAGMLVLFGVVAVLWLVNAVVITSLFTFRVRDVARLAAYSLTRTPGATLGTAGVLIGAAAITAVTSEAV